MIASPVMPRGLVLVIEDDESVSGQLAVAIREADYEVIVCSTAKVGLETACELKPDCIVCDVDLPDSDGYSVARTVRTHPSRVSVAPFLFLAPLDDEKSRLEGFHVGADVYMTKPFRVEDVVAQVDALVQMAARLRQRRDSMLSMPPGAQQSAIEGDLGQMSIATVLTVLEMERRTGIFEVVSKKRRAQLELAKGCVVKGTVGGTHVSALTALRAMLTWNVGRFSFTPAPSVGEAPQSHKSIGAFLIEALRLEDEAARADLDLPPSRRRPSEVKVEQRLAAPALGGPASSPADFAPPSSRTPEFIRAGDLPLSYETELSDWELPSRISPPPPMAEPLSVRFPARISRPAVIPPPPPSRTTLTLGQIPAAPATPNAGPLPRPAPPPRPDPEGKKR